MLKYTSYFAKTVAQLGKCSIGNTVEAGAVCMSLRNIHITSSAAKQVRHAEGISSKLQVGTDKWTTADDGTSKSFNLDMMTTSESILFPDSQTPEKLFDGKPYKLLPIVYVKATPNNTIILLASHRGGKIWWNTCGIEGFKKCRKGTNVAAQQTATSFASKVTKQGYTNVRVLLEGVGPGRMSSLKGLEIGGLNIVSITDNTRISRCPAKAKKRRRL